MSKKLKIYDTPGNSPLKTVPSDYFPKGCGFWFELTKGIDKGKKLFFRDSTHGTRNPEDTIVFVHGNPECSYTYRKIIQNLVNSAIKPFRIVAMDHIGFGLSDQASFEMVCMDHANNLLQLIQYLDLQKVTLVIHDWGGPIGVGAFLKEPERISNLVILNSTVFPLSNRDLTYKNYPRSWLSWSITPYIIPNRYWGSFASFVIYLEPSNPIKILTNMIRYIILFELGVYKGSETIAQKIFREQFQSKSNVRSSKRLVLQTPVWGYGNIYKEPKVGNRDTTPFYRFIQANISKFWGPEGQNIGVRAILGHWDPLAKNEVVKQWETHLPQLKDHVKVFKGVGHFIEEIKPKEITNIIIEVANLN
ncbi:MAG: alpha/beta hydrolase [Promethearchaeota archaeon]